MRTPEEILDQNELTGSLFCRDIDLNQRDRDDFIFAIKQAQQEAYEEGRKDGYATCKSDYATQITYNK